MKALILILLISGVFFFIPCSGQGLGIGDDATSVKFSNIINAQTSFAKVSDYDSKIVILDFWATWCGPCIESLPHIEQLQKEFPGEVKVFTVNQSDSRVRIEKFLGKRQLGLPIVRDTAYTLNEYFPHRIIPHTVIIGKDGKVVAITSPDKVTSELIGELINQKGVNLQVKKEAMEFDPSRPLVGDGSSEFLFVINKFIPGNSSMVNTNYPGSIYENRRILLSNLDLNTIFRVAYQIPSIEEISLEVREADRFEWMDANLFCVDLIVPEPLGEKRFEILQNYLTLNFPYKTDSEKKLADIKLLRIKSGASFKLRDTGKEKNENYSISGRGLKADDASIEALVNLLNFNNLAGKPVFDETGLKGTYNFDVPYYLEDSKNIFNELDKLGLELVDSTKELKFWYLRDK